MYLNYVKLTALLAVNALIQICPGRSIITLNMSLF